MGDERLDRRAVSVNSRARAAQYELSLSTQLTLSVASTVVLDAVEVSVQSEYFEEIENLAGTQDEIHASHSRDAPQPCAANNSARQRSDSVRKQVWK